MTTLWLSSKKLSWLSSGTTKKLSLLLKKTSSQVQPLTTLKLSIGDNLLTIRWQIYDIHSFCVYAEGEAYLWHMTFVGPVVPELESVDPKKNWVPTFIFLAGVFPLHRSIRHPGNQLTMALLIYRPEEDTSRNARSLPLLAQINQRISNTKHLGVEIFLYHY